MEGERNYECQTELSKELDRLIAGLNGLRPSLLLHACCAPCSSYVLEYLSRYFQITLFFYNPNIAPESEYQYRVSELRRLVTEMLPDAGITVLEGPYDPERFARAVRGLEGAPEGGALPGVLPAPAGGGGQNGPGTGGVITFTTTLSISPMKDAAALNGIGEELAPIYQTPWLPSDFKKREGYKRSIQLSAEYQLYRQDYCGCIYSKLEQEAQKQRKGVN